MVYLYLYNTKTKLKEKFIPIDQKSIKIYVCGPTVYDLMHLGNARSLVVYDVLYRILSKIYNKENIIYIRNITDIDDKIIKKANQLGISIKDFTNSTVKEFHKDHEYLKCLPPSYEPKATDHIKEIISIIKILLDKKHAYIVDNNVYFDVKSYSDYYNLSSRNLSNNLHGTRIEEDLKKRNIEDFILWKSSNIDNQVFFNSPWGNGCPGWHIECSAMSNKYLGENFDIHGGGIDLIFPHHTNEIAQSICAFPGSEYANFWVHNGFLTVNGEKMSKSLDNFVKVRELLEKGVPGEILRFVLLNTHYRKPLHFRHNLLQEAKKNLDYLYGAIKVITKESIFTNNYPKDFMAMLFNDLNTHKALSYLIQIANKIYRGEASYSIVLKECANLLGILQYSYEEWHKMNNMEEKKIELLIQKRKEAKLAKNWQLADKIRNDLENENIFLKDDKEGNTTWYKNNIP